MKVKPEDWHLAPNEEVEAREDLKATQWEKLQLLPRWDNPHEAVDFVNVPPNAPHFGPFPVATAKCPECDFAH